MTAIIFGFTPEGIIGKSIFIFLTDLVDPMFKCHHCSSIRVDIRYLYSDSAVSMALCCVTCILMNGIKIDNHAFEIIALAFWNQSGDGVQNWSQLQLSINSSISVTVNHWNQQKQSKTIVFFVTVGSKHIAKFITTSCSVSASSYSFNSNLSSCNVASN